jgi:hypothetical protein
MTQIDEQRSRQPIFTGAQIFRIVCRVSPVFTTAPSRGCTEGSDPAPDFPTWGTTMVSTADLLAPCSDRYMSLIDKLPSLIIGTSERILSYLGVVLERLISYFQYLSTMYVNNKVEALTIRYERP